MVRLLICSAGLQGLKLELQPGTNLVGRNGSNHCPLQHPSISGGHCEITLTDGLVFVRDLGSTNGTFIDWERVTASTELHPGQMLRIGEVDLVLEQGEALPPVAIPVITAPELPTPLPADEQVCANHAHFIALFQCTECGKLFCRQCVHQIRLVGKKPNRFCPACKGQCAPYQPAGAKKENFLTRAWRKATGLKKTLKLHSKDDHRS